MTKQERFLARIPAAIQTPALECVNRVRAYLGATPLKKLPLKGAENTVATSPISLAVMGLFADDPTRDHKGFPDGAPGNIKRDVGGCYTTVWEIYTPAVGEDLARIFGTECKRMEKREYCCHRHFDEDALVVVLPQALVDYEQAVVEASDAASECENCGRRWYE